MEGRAALESRNLTLNKATCRVLFLKRTNPSDSTGWALMGWRARLGGPGSGGAVWTLTWPTNQDKWLFNSLSISYATLTILCPVLVFLCKRDINKLGQVKWEGTGMVRAGAMDLWGKAEEYGLFQPGQERLHENLTVAPPQYIPGGPWEGKACSSLKFMAGNQNSGYKPGQRSVWLDM